MNIHSSVLLLVSLLPATLLFSRNNSLHRAAAKGNLIRCEKLLKKGVSLHKKDKYGYTPLHSASFYGQKDICLFFIEKGAQVSQKNRYGGTALHCASWFGEKDTCLALIEKGAKVNAKNKFGFTPLYAASWRGYKDTCLALIENGAHVNEKDDYGKTALHIASWAGHQDTCLALIANGVQVNEKDDSGHTALHVASWCGHKDICLALIEKGAQISEKIMKKRAHFTSGYTPLDMALEQGHDEICELLLLYGSNLSMHAYLYFFKFNQAKKLINQFANRMKLGENALHWAAEKGDEKAFDFLIKKGFNIYLLTSQGKSVLDFAKSKKIRDIIRPYEEIKVAGYLRRIKPRGDIPPLIISLILSVYVGEKDDDCRNATFRKSW